jgi:hypothetical protein
MGHLILQGDNIAYPGFSLLGESSLAITFDDTGTNFLALDFLVLSGTTSVSIDSTGTFGAKSSNAFTQLAETNNDLATVTISGPVSIFLGTLFSNSNAGDGVVTDTAARATSPTTIHSSLKLIDASATTGEVDILPVAQTRAALVTSAMVQASMPTSRSPTPGSRSRAARAAA